MPLRRLSDTDPELARAVVKQKSDFDKREHTSFRIALIVTTVLALALLAVMALAILNEGIVKSVILVALILAMGMVLRVILTGKWSETSWVGNILDNIPGLSGKPSTDASNED